MPAAIVVLGETASWGIEEGVMYLVIVIELDLSELISPFGFKHRTQYVPDSINTLVLLVPLLIPDPVPSGFIIYHATLAPGAVQPFVVNIADKLFED